MTDTDASKAGAAARAMILPLALAQFIASYAATNMNVAISAIATDLGTTRGRGADGDHAVHAHDGGADDPGQQADRHLGPQAVLRDRPGRLRGRGPAGGAVAGTAAADHRVLAAGGRGLGADDPADLHPGHGDLPRRQVAGQVLRRGQRRGRAGRRRRAADRRAGDQRDQLARLVRPAGPGGGLDHLAGPQDHRPGPGRAPAAVRPDRGGAVRRRAVLRGARAAAVADLRLRRVAAGLHHRRARW